MLRILSSTCIAQSDRVFDTPGIRPSQADTRIPSIVKFIIHSSSATLPAKSCASVGNLAFVLVLEKGNPPFCS